ncbi:MAG: transglycosylase domain-containing protein, partial [Bacillota bacterium]
MTARKRRRKLRVGRLLTVLALGFACIVLLAGLGLFFISLRDLPSFDTAALSTANATTVYDRENKPVGTIGVENRVPVKIKDIPERVQQAFLAAEDHRFYEHHGVDFIGIFRAAITDLLGRGLHQGASTITQQLVKQSFLTPEKTFKRKIQEVILAVQLERHYTKPEILEMYLNKIYFGEGAYGIQSAARLYFNKDAAKLSLPEAALLAGVIRAPSYYSPYQNPEAAKK